MLRSVFALLACVGFAAEEVYRPVAIFHGIDDSCPGIQKWVDMIDDALNNTVPVKCVEIGNGRISSIFEMMPWQEHSGCKSLVNDPDFMQYDEINIVGISQGSLVSRAIIERCEGLPKVHTFFTYGGPHGGVSAYKKCDGVICNILNKAVGAIADFIITQYFVAPADYYREWWNLERYYNNSIFLPELNNELNDPLKPWVTPAHKRKAQKERIVSLEHFAMLKWLNDTVVSPRESEWFGHWDENKNLVEMRDQNIYYDDLLGLKTLDEAGKLHFYTAPGEHMHLEEWMITDLLVPFLIDADELPASEY